jgi:hypothetical protein
MCAASVARVCVNWDLGSGICFNIGQQPSTTFAQIFFGTPIYLAEIHVSFYEAAGRLEEPG